MGRCVCHDRIHGEVVASILVGNKESGEDESAHQDGKVQAEPGRGRHRHAPVRCSGYADP